MSAFDEQVGGEHYLAWPIQLMEFFIKNKVGKAEGDAIQYILRQKAHVLKTLTKQYTYCKC